MRRIAKLVFLLELILFAASTARAQTQTTVTATVTDPNGIPYAGGTVKAQISPPGVTSPCVTTGGNCVPIQGTVGPAPLDSTGKFTLSLYPNASITPAATQWTFTVCIAPGVVPPFGKGPQCFSAAATIAGASQDVSAILNAVAPALSWSTVGGGGLSGQTVGGIPVAATATTSTSSIFPSGYAGVAQSVACITGSPCTVAPEGVVPDATNPTTLPIVDRLRWINWTSGTGMTIPALTSGNGLDQNVAFHLTNTSGGSMNLTPTTPNNIRCGVSAMGTGQAPCAVPNDWTAFVFSDNSNLFAVLLPMTSGGGVAVNKTVLTAQAADVAATTILTPGANGWYRISCYAVVTQAATTSSTLPRCDVLYTDGDSSFAEAVTVAGNSPANTVGTLGNSPNAGIPLAFFAKTGVAIQYRTVGYASVGATPMQFAIRTILEGPF